jgi:hypothetical protein
MSGYVNQTIAPELREKHRSMMTPDAIADEIARREGRPDPHNIIRGLRLCLALARQT